MRWRLKTFTGTISNHCGYKHANANLCRTIIKMTQDFIGKNIIIEHSNIDVVYVRVVKKLMFFLQVKSWVIFMIVLQRVASACLYPQWLEIMPASSSTFTSSNCSVSRDAKIIFLFWRFENWNRQTSMEYFNLNSQ
jgi:hypothetical protein